MADESVVNLPVMDIDDLKPTTIIYAIEAGDKRIAFGTIENKILGADVVSAVGGDDLITFTVNDGSRVRISFSDLYDKIQGTIDYDGVEDENMLKMIVDKDDLNTAGFVSAKVVKDYMDSAEDADIDDLGDNTNVYLSVFDANTNKSRKLIVPFNILTNAILGTSSSETIDPDESLYKVTPQGEKSKITYDNLRKSLLPDTEVEEIADGTIVYGRASTNRGNITIGTIYDHIIEKLDLPDYSGNGTSIDRDTVKFEYRVGEDSGLMGIGELRPLLINVTVKDSIDNGTLLQGSEGVYPFQVLSDTIVERVSDMYNIDISAQADQILDGDGIMFVTNGSQNQEYNNISFLSLEQKINKNGVATSTSLNDSSMVRVDDGWVSLGDIKSYLGL